MRTSGHDLSAHDDDPTEYPERGGLGKDFLEMLVASNFRPLLESFLDERQVQAFVGANQFIYYVRGDPNTRVLPSIYVMPNIDRTKLEYLGCWKTWQTGAIPCFALEIVSIHNWKKKAELKSPRRHDVLGTKELVVLDPYADERFKLRGRTRFRIFRRDSSGRLVLVHSTNERQIQSETLGCFLRVVGVGNSQRLRIATGPNGETLFPTRAEAEAQHAHEALQRANDEARRASNAEAELARLRAEIAVLKRRD